MTNNIDDKFDNPDNLETMFREAGEGDSFKRWKKELEDGPHPSREILVDYANKSLDESARTELFEHISHCSRCSQEVYAIRSKTRKLEKIAGQDGFQLRNWRQFLTNIDSPNRIVISPASPNESLYVGPKKTTSDSIHDARPILQVSSSPCDEFFFWPSKQISVKIEIPQDGYLIAFAYTNPASIRLVFPASKKDCTLISYQLEKTLVLSHQSRRNSFFLKAIWTSKKLLDFSTADYNGSSVNQLKLIAISLNRLSCEKLATGSCKISFHQTSDGKSSSKAR